jgi:hypothetical protein
MASDYFYKGWVLVFLRACSTLRLVHAVKQHHRHDNLPTPNHRSEEAVNVQLHSLARDSQGHTAPRIGNSMRQNTTLRDVPLLRVIRLVSQANIAEYWIIASTTPQLHHGYIASCAEIYSRRRVYISISKEDVPENDYVAESQVRPWMRNRTKSLMNIHI